MNAAAALPGPPPLRRAWQAARNVLLVRLDNLGDVLMTTPALWALRHGAADRRLTLLASPGGAALRPHLPWLDDCIVYDAPWSKGSGGSRAPAADATLVDALARRHFDAAILFTVCTQSALPAALLCRLAGIPLRLAYSRENPYELLTDWQPDHEVCADGMRHEVQRQIDLVRSVGFDTPAPHLRFDVRVADRASLQRQLAQAGVDPARPHVVVHPGATAASRRWPAQRFGEAAAQISTGLQCQVLVTGGPGDRAGVDDAMRAAGTCAGRGVIALPASLSLGELAALIESARAVLCNNSGPAHLAAALGTPVVVVYAMTNPQHTPWQVPSRVLQRLVPCRHCLKSACPLQHHACLTDVPVSEAVDAVQSLVRGEALQRSGTPTAAPVVPVAA